MNKILCFGEALIDMLNTQADNYQAFVGGAPANVAVGIAKLGGTAAFLGQVGNDKFGRDIIEFLLEHKVEVRDLYIHPSAKTALAFVQLDQTGDRSFSFYREQTADVLMDKSQLTEPTFMGVKVFHLCSNTLTTQIGCDLTEQAISMAKAQGAVVSFDLNLRDELWPERKIDLAKIQSVIAQADLVKFSEEELALVANSNSTEYINQCLAQGTRLVIVTKGGEPIEYFTKGHCGQVQVGKTEVLDTTGAGDSFVAGLLTAMASIGEFNRLTQDSQLLERTIAFASECSGITVSRYGACASFPVLTEVKNHYGLF